jgi:hypothetical protein
MLTTRLCAIEETSEGSNSGASLFNKYRITPYPGLPKGYLSVSQVSTYLKCPKQYFYRYVTNIESQGSIDLTIGKLTHKVIELVIGGNSGTYAEIAKTALDKAIMLNEHTASSEDKNILSKVVALAEAFLSSTFVATHEILEMEKEILFLIEDREITPYSVPVLGFVDLICRNRKTGEMCIGDIKTVGKNYSQSQVDDNLQLWAYSLALGISNTMISCLNKKTETCVELSSNVSDQNRKHAAKILFDVAQSIEKQAFNRCMPNDWWCSPKWCAYYTACVEG